MASAYWQSAAVISRVGRRPAGFCYLSEHIGKGREKAVYGLSAGQSAWSGPPSINYARTLAVDRRKTSVQVYCDLNVCKRVCFTPPYQGIQKMPVYSGISRIGFVRSMLLARTNVVTT